MTKYKCRRQDSAKPGMCLLFLTLPFMPISVAILARSISVQAPGLIAEQQLEPGKPVEREIAEEQTHSYHVKLAGGEFIHLFIYQRGVNVGATLIAPDGKKLLEADIPRSTQEAEWITHLAAAAGEYRVEIRTVEKGSPSGRYEIKIEELRKSAAGDEARLSAQEAFAEANRLFGERNYRGALEKYQGALSLYRQSERRVEEAVILNCIARSNAAVYDYQAAIERYKEALSIYREMADVQGEGHTLHEIGNAFFAIGRYDDAIAHWEQALARRRNAGYRAGEGMTLNNLGNANNSLSRSEKAIEYYQQALAIRREVKDRAGEGLTLNNLGIAHADLSRYDEAISYYQEALAIFRGLKNRGGEVLAVNNIGRAYISMGRYEKAIEYSEQAVSIFRELKDRAGEGRALTNLGVSYNSVARYEDAIQYFEQSLTIKREVKDRAGEGITLINVGHAYRNLGRYEKAIEYYIESLAMFRELKNRMGEARALTSLGNSYALLARYEQSIQFYEQALIITREVKDRSAEAYTISNLGAGFMCLRQYEKAIEYCEQSLVIFREVKDRVGEGIALSNLGESYYSLGQYGTSIGYLQESLGIFREVGHRAGEGRALTDLTLLWEQQNNSPIAIFYGKQAVNVLQEIRGNIKSLDKESQQSYLKSHEDTYRKLADLLISQGRLAEAEKVLELLKEEEFNRILRRNGPSDPKIGLTNTETEATKIADQLAVLASERGPLLAKFASKSATDQDRQRLNQIEAAITEANQKIKLVLAEVAKASADDKLMTQQSQSMMQSLRKLGPGSVALYTVLTNEKGWVILTTPDFRRAYPINTTDLNKTVSDFRATLKSDRYDPIPLAQRLYGAIFLQKNEQGATLAGDLKSYGARTLMWFLDGVLRYVPISALHDGKGYLVERYPNLVFTTASLTRLLDAARGNWRAFGLGVSKGFTEFPALTAVPRELHSIIREAGAAQSRGVLPGVIRLDEQFTRKAMIDGLREGYPVVHVASHFRFNAEKEETSFLLLGDGSHLSLEEMQNLPGIFEGVELLTLSACDTATAGANGKEVEGLAFVAQDLGAKAVVASLWPVADVGTEVLMREFYGLKQANPQWSKAEALRQAQMALVKGRQSSQQASAEQRGPTVEEAEGRMNPYKRDARAPFAHPHYWAPFILIGNWK